MKTISLKAFNTIGLIILAIFLVFIFSISLSSCKKESKEKSEKLCPVVASSTVPQVVKDAFSLKYPSTNVITWFNKDSVAFSAYFMTPANAEILARFANDGSFIMEEIETNQTRQHEDSTGTVGKLNGGCECEIHSERD
ncbi:MAG TPA: hypothetical protein VIL78_05915 [Hanamia sp.]